MRQTAPFTGIPLERADGRPIRVVVEADQPAGAVTQVGWIDVQTGVFSPGPPPAGVRPAVPRGLRGVRGFPGVPGGRDNRFNVMDYAAQFADTPQINYDIPAGFTFDSSMAFQNALDDAASHGGGTVYAPSGFFIASFDIPAQCAIEGSGRAQTFIHAPPGETVRVIGTKPKVYTDTEDVLSAACFTGVRKLAVIGNAPLANRPYGGHYSGQTTSFGPTSNGTGEVGINFLSASAGTLVAQHAAQIEDVIVYRCSKDGIVIDAGFDEVFGHDIWCSSHGRYGIVLGCRDSTFVNCVSGNNGVRVGNVASGAVVGGVGWALLGGLPTPERGGSVHSQFANCWSGDNLRSDWSVAGTANRWVGCGAENSPVGWDFHGSDPTITADEGPGAIPALNVGVGCVSLGNETPLLLDAGASFPTVGSLDFDLSVSGANSDFKIKSLVTFAAVPDDRIRLKLGLARLLQGNKVGLEVADDFSAVVLETSRNGLTTPVVSDLSGTQIEVVGLDGRQWAGPGIVNPLSLDLFKGTDVTLFLNGPLVIGEVVDHGAVLPGQRLSMTFVQDAVGGRGVIMSETFLSPLDLRPEPFATTTVEWVNISDTLAPLWVLGDAANAHSLVPATVTPDAVPGLIQWNKLPIAGVIPNNPVDPWPFTTAGVNLVAPNAAGRPVYRTTGATRLINGHDCVEFQLTNNPTSLSGSYPAVLPQPFTLFIVAMFTGMWTSTQPGGTDTIIDSPDAANALWVSGGRWNQSPTLANRGTYGVDNGVLATSSVANDLRPHVFECVVNGGRSRLLRDGVVLLDAATGAEGWSGVVLGEHSLTDHNNNFFLVGEILGYNRVLSPSEAGGVRSYLSSRFDIPVVYPGSYIYSPMAQARDTVSGSRSSATATVLGEIVAALAKVGIVIDGTTP